MIDMHYLRIFYVSCCTKSFTKAASTLYVSQSAVSIQIKKLESQLGVQLIERTSKKFKLTYAGQELFKMTQGIFEKIDRVEREMQRVVSNEKNKITIGSTHNVAEPLFPDIVSMYKRHKPEIEFDIYVKNKESLLKNFNEGKIDVLLLNSKEPVSSDVILIPSEKYPVVLVTPPHVNNIQELSELYFLRRDDEFHQENTDLFLKHSNFEIKKEMMVNGSIETIKKLIIEGVGYSLLPYYSVSFDVSKSRMKVLKKYNEDTRINILVLKEQYKKPWISEFINYLQTEYSLLSSRGESTNSESKNKKVE